MQERNEDFWGTGGEKLYFCGKAQKKTSRKLVWKNVILRGGRSAGRGSRCRGSAGCGWL